MNIAVCTDCGKQKYKWNREWKSSKNFERCKAGASVHKNLLSVRRKEMVSAADLFRIKSGRKYLTNINHVINVSSILKQGLLCHDRARMVEHQSLALESVQNRRAQKGVPSGLALHQYVNLYFAPRNPMMYHIRCNRDIENTCVLLVSPEVLDIDGTVITDGNAASDITRFYAPYEGISVLEYEKIYAKYWTDENPYVQDEKKRKKCAEVLVPWNISANYITGALTPTLNAKEILMSRGFDREIIVHPYTFFIDEVNR